MMHYNDDSDVQLQKWKRLGVVCVCGGDPHWNVSGHVRVNDDLLGSTNVAGAGLEWIIRDSPVLSQAAPSFPLLSLCHLDVMSPDSPIG